MHELFTVTVGNEHVAFWQGECICDVYSKGRSGVGIEWY